jgi:hypothetical protein
MKLFTQTGIHLNRRALYRTIAAKNTTIALYRFKNYFTFNTLIEK